MFVHHGCHAACPGKPTLQNTQETIQETSEDMTTPKDSDLREALRRKYADTPQLPSDFMNRMQQASQKNRQRSSFFICHSPLVTRRFAAVFSIAAVLLIAFLLWPESHEETLTQQEVKPIVAEAEPQPVPQPIIEEKEEEVMAEVQTTQQPAKKRRKAVKKRSAPVEPVQTEVEPLLAEAAALFDEGRAPNNDLTDPFLDSDEFAREIRSQGERLNGKIAQMMIK